METFCYTIAFTVISGALILSGALIQKFVGKPVPDYRAVFEAEKAARQRAEHELECVRIDRAANSRLLAEIRTLLINH